MTRPEIIALLMPGARLARVDATVYAVIMAAAVMLWWLCNWQAAILPFFAPWDFSFVEFLSAWLIGWWYLRGMALTPMAKRPSFARRAAFFAGLLAVYIVLETRYEYLAEHEFFFNRIQHVTMHHLGPFLMALAWPGETLARGAPQWVLRLGRHPTAKTSLAVSQQPIIAGFLFVGLIFFWLIPAVHFRAMIDPRLFALMNWSMLLDGVLFWFLVLDPRPAPPARTSFGARAALAGLVMFPQIAGGAVIALARTDIYPYYDLCGRIFPNLGPLYDQTIGGVIIWIPPAMMSVVAVVLVLNLLRKSEETTSHANIVDDDYTGPIIDTSAWTGR